LSLGEPNVQKRFAPIFIENLQETCAQWDRRKEELVYLSLYKLSRSRSIRGYWFYSL